MRIETDFVSDEVHDNRYASKKWNLVLKTLILIRKIKVIPVWPCVHLYEECKIYNFFYQKYTSYTIHMYGHTQTLIQMVKQRGEDLMLHFFKSHSWEDVYLSGQKLIKMLNYQKYPFQNWAKVSVKCINIEFFDKFKKMKCKNVKKNVTSKNILECAISMVATYRKRTHNNRNRTPIIFVQVNFHLCLYMVITSQHHGAGPI